MLHYMLYYRGILPYKHGFQYAASKGQCRVNTPFYVLHLAYAPIKLLAHTLNVSIGPHSTYVCQECFLGICQAGMPFFWYGIEDYSKRLLGNILYAYTVPYIEAFCQWELLLIYISDRRQSRSLNRA